jgi:hypothetical protein
MASQRVSCIVPMLLIAPLFLTGCSASSVYKKAAKIGLEMVGEAVTEDRVQTESSQLLGRPTGEADRRFGNPRGVFVDVASGREVRVYSVKDDLLGQKRWVIESIGGRADAL